MFRIEAEPKFWTEVKVKLPGEPEQKFRARFRVIAASVAAATDFADPAAAGKFFADALADIDDIEEESGRKAKFAPSLVAALIDQPHVRAALARAYAEGVAAAARGN